MELIEAFDVCMFLYVFCPLYGYNGEIDCVSLCVGLTLSMLGKNFSRQHFEIVFLFFFLRKQALTFYTNCLLKKFI